MNYARILNKVVVEVIDFDPNGRFTDDIVKLFVTVPDGTGTGDTKNTDGTFTKYIPPVVVVTPPVINWKISCLSFRNRFTKAEKQALYTAAKTNVDIQIYLDDVQAATYIDLSKADTIANVQGLEAATLIGVGRATIILTTVPDADEQYN